MTNVLPTKFLNEPRGTAGEGDMFAHSRNDIFESPWRKGHRRKIWRQTCSPRVAPKGQFLWSPSLSVAAYWRHKPELHSGNPCPSRFEKNVW